MHYSKIRVFDKGFPGLRSSDTTVKFKISNVNDHAPIFDKKVNF